MSTSFFNLAVKQWLIKQGLDVSSVIKVTQETVQQGYCETCYSEDEVWVIVFVDSFGETTVYEHNDWMSNFVTELSELEVV